MHDSILTTQLLLPVSKLLPYLGELLFNALLFMLSIRATPDV